MNGEDERDLEDRADWDYYAAGLWRPNSRYPTYTTSEPKSVSPEEAAKLMASCDKSSNQWILDQMKIEASKGVIMENENNDIYAIGVDYHANPSTIQIVTAYLAGLADASGKRIEMLNERTSLLDPLLGRYNIKYLPNYKIGRDEFEALRHIIPDEDERAKVVRIKLQYTMVPKYVAMIMGSMDKE